MMQSGRGDHGGGSDEMSHNQRLKPQPQPTPQPLQCPRCDSLNTKFCYYNNYSLSQPRHFCKTCRRYWTHGGTQRNVPIGGGSRKAKSTETTSSGENFRRTKESGVPSMGSSYYPGEGGFLSSLAAIQSVQPTQPFNQPVNLGVGDLAGSSNLGMLQGFNLNVNVPSFRSNQQKSCSLGLLDPPDQQQSLMMQSSRPSAPSSSLQNWPLNFIQITNRNVSDTTMWSAVSPTTSPTAGSSTATPLNPNEWPRFPGYGAPP